MKVQQLEKLALARLSLNAPQSSYRYHHYHHHCITFTTMTVITTITVIVIQHPVSVTMFAIRTTIEKHLGGPFSMKTDYLATGGKLPIVSQSNCHHHLHLHHNHDKHQHNHHYRHHCL